MRVIPLYHKNVVVAHAIVDGNDYEKVSKLKWVLHRGYAQCSTAQGTIMLHRFIIDAPKGSIVDHKSRDKLDNRRDNLRLCDSIDNRRNVGPMCRNKLGVKGVRIAQNTTDKIYKTDICVGGKKKHLGYYSTLKEAAMVYDREAKKLFGEFAYLNYPQGG